MPIVSDIKTLSTNEAATAQANAQAHESLGAAVMAEAENLRAMATRFDGKVMVEAETIYSAFKAHLVRTGKCLENEADIIVTEVKGLLHL